MNELNINIYQTNIKVSKGTKLIDIAQNYQDRFKNNIIIAKVNGKYKELQEPLIKDCTVEFEDLTTKGGNRVYLSGLIYLLIYSYKELFGQSEDIKVNHSIDKGLYIESSKSLIEEDLRNLEKKMHENVAKDLPITKLNVSRIDAINYFQSIKDEPKVGIMKYNTNTYITLYKLGNMYNYFYTLMPSSTKHLDKFELTYLNDHGFVLRYLTIYMKDTIKEYEHRTNVFNLFKESSNWGRLMNIENVVDLNYRVSNSTIEELIKIDEMMQSNRLINIARSIAEKTKRPKIILIAGPSSSGKTTTCNRLALCLKCFGMYPKMISMDDFFVERHETPLDEDGKPDFERLEAVDLKLFEKTMIALLNKEEVQVPTFNFVAGSKEFKRKMKIEDNEILLIEGIHALNPQVLANIPKEDKVTIYLSALTELKIDNHTRVSTTDNRLLRRIVRDNRTRGSSVEKSLETWAKVRNGEEKYIFPYQDCSDYTFNTALIYELGVLKTYVEPLLYSVDPTSPYYNEAKRLIDFLKVFLPIPSERIPEDSILREFVGGSCYKV